MKTKKEQDLELEAELVKATKGKKNTAIILKAVFEPIRNLRFS